MHSTQRKIIHIDMDAFYASVELRSRPHLRHLPVIIAYDQPRSVVCAASYPARQFGLRSAMPTSQAKKRCPQVIIIEPNFPLYRQVSAQIHQIFNKYTDHIEPIALDEAYLDVSQNKLNIATATEVAQRIRQNIWQQTQLTASAGVAPNKFLAKIASDWQKPNGLFVIKPHQIQQFIQQLPLNKIPGVGRVTQQKLAALHLQTLGDLQKIDEHLLIQHFGKYGKQLAQYAQGIDLRPVVSERIRQQISKEITFLNDLKLAECHAHWQKLAGTIWQQLQQKQLVAYGLSIKLKRPDFKIIQHSQSFKRPFQHPQELLHVAHRLLDDLHLHHQDCFRLIGLGLYQLQTPSEKQQLSLIE
ncbi:MAG: DNA polymerase IV [Acinetobacter sp.]|nr:DNA polymerase IV [Acinetobacter sp.]